MTTELRPVTPTISQTRFFGGSERGPCVQITQSGLSPTAMSMTMGLGMVQLTRTEAALLAAELLRFASGTEVEEV